MTVCREPGCVEHYGCRLRNKGILLSPAATASRSQNMVPTQVDGPAFNREIMRDHRNMPILKPNGDPVRRKEWGEKRHSITETLRRVKAGN